MPEIPNAHPVNARCPICCDYRHAPGMDYPNPPIEQCRKSFRYKHRRYLTCWRVKGHSGPCGWCRLVSTDGVTSYIQEPENREPT